MSDDRCQHWDKVYSSKTTDDLSWYQSSPALSLTLIAKTGLDVSAEIIDVGGGASKLTEKLLAEGYQKLTVLDISSEAIEKAKQQLASNAERVEWIISDITRFENKQRYDLWHDRAVFHFLTDKTDQDNYIQALRRQLLQSGYIIIATFAIGGPDKCSGLPIVQYDAKKLTKRFGEDFTLLAERSERHITPSGSEQLFNYFLLQYSA